MSFDRIARYGRESVREIIQCGSVQFSAILFVLAAGFHLLTGAPRRAFMIDYLIALIPLVLHLIGYCIGEGMADARREKEG